MYIRLYVSVCVTYEYTPAVTSCSPVPPDFNTSIPLFWPKDDASAPCQARFPGNPPQSVPPGEGINAGFGIFLDDMNSAIKYYQFLICLMNSYLYLVRKALYFVEGFFEWGILPPFQRYFDRDNMINYWSFGYSRELQPSIPSSW